MTRNSTSDATARLQAEEAARDLSRQLKQALKAPEGERSAEASALLAANPEAVARHQSAMDRTAARKLQDEANATEIEEDAEELQQKVVRLAELLRAAKHAVIYTGAGVSTSASIPDYRGPQGIWTMHKKGAHNANSAARADMMGMAFVDAQPTPTHMGLAALTARGLVQSVVSQNVDGLHLRSGVPARALCELHGNVFREQCSECAKEYLRGFDVTEKSSYHRHATPRVCASTLQNCPCALLQPVPASRRHQSPPARPGRLPGPPWTGEERPCRVAAEARLAEARLLCGVLLCGVRSRACPAPTCARCGEAAPDLV